MTLDDQFNPNDGSFLDQLDNVYYGVNRKLAKKWQDKTGLSKRKLETGLYSLASLAFMGSYYFRDNPFPGYLDLTLASSMLIDAFSYSMRPSSALDQQLSCESVGLPPKTKKLFNTLFYSYGLLGLTAMGLCASNSFISGNYENFSLDLDSFAHGMAFFFWKTADYISQSNIPEPPPKPKREKLSEKFERFVDGLKPAKPIPGF